MALGGAAWDAVEHETGPFSKESLAVLERRPVHLHPRLGEEWSVRGTSRYIALNQDDGLLRQA